MDNHQLELAEKMFLQNYLLFSNCKSLFDKFEMINDYSLAKYVPENPKLFGNHLEKLFS